jgi:hypothetical protein
MLIVLSQLSKIGRLVSWICVGRELCLRNFIVIQNLELICDLFVYVLVKNCDINFEISRKSPGFHTYTTLMQNFLINKIKYVYSCHRFLTWWKRPWISIHVVVTSNMMERCKFKGHKFLGPWKSHWLYSGFLLLVIGNKSTYLVNMG